MTVQELRNVLHGLPEGLEVVTERWVQGRGYLTSTVWGVGIQGRYLVITVQED